MTITTKFPGTCAFCGAEVSRGQTADYNPATKQLRHALCTRYVKGVSLRNVRNPDTAVAHGWTYTVSMRENQHGEFIVHLSISEFARTFTKTRDHNGSGPTSRELAERNYKHAINYAKAQGAIEQSVGTV